MKPRKKFVLSSDLKDDVPESEWKGANRANGQSLCVCGLMFTEHYQPIQLTCPTIIEDCEGNWWKL